MILKDKSKFTRWQFWMQDPEGNEFCLPGENEYASSFPALYTLIMDQIKAFPPSYKDLVRHNADKLGMTFSQYIEMSIEHQICKRQPNPLDVCWEGGLGDHIHTLAGKIDAVVDTMPSMFKSMAELATGALTFATTGKAQKRFGSCQTCGGTKTFSPDKNSLGRAGIVNTFVPNNLTTVAKK
jgi:hypothetical protein